MNMRGPQFEALLLLAFQNVPSLFLWRECFCNFCAFVVSNCAPTAPGAAADAFCIGVIVGSGPPPKPCPRFHAPQLVQRPDFSDRQKNIFTKISWEPPEEMNERIPFQHCIFYSSLFKKSLLAQHRSAFSCPQLHTHCTLYLAHRYARVNSQ